MPKPSQPECDSRKGEGTSQPLPRRHCPFPLPLGLPHKKQKGTPQGQESICTHASSFKHCKPHEGHAILPPRSNASITRVCSSAKASALSSLPEASRLRAPCVCPTLVCTETRSRAVSCKFAGVKFRASRFSAHAPTSPPPLPPRISSPPEDVRASVRNDITTWLARRSRQKLALELRGSSRACSITDNLMAPHWQSLAGKTLSPPEG
jgi:hypothetical protein